MATCKDCIHCEACERMISDTSKMFKVLLSEILKMNCDIKYDSTNILSGAEICQCFQDRARFVELPCNVGDSVFTIDEKGNIQECTVINVNCKIQMTLDKKLWTDFIIATEPEDDSLPFPMIFTYSITKNRILFLTRESAEQTLKEREENA